MQQKALSVAPIHDPQTTHPGPGSLSEEKPNISVTEAFFEFITGEMLNIWTHQVFLFTVLETDMLSEAVATYSVYSVGHLADIVS